MKDIRDIHDLTPDPENLRVHTPRGQTMLVETLARLGAGRSVVVDEDGVVLAGNGTVDAAKEAGLTDVVVVDATPDTLVAVRRSNLSEEEKTQLALADNRALEFSRWDVERLTALQASGLDVSAFFNPEELQALTETPDPHVVVQKTKRENKRAQLPEAIRFEMVLIPLEEDASIVLKGELDAWIERHGSSDGFGSLLVRRAEEALRERG